MVVHLRTLNHPSSHRILAIAETLLVTLIWGSSFVLIKYGLAWVGPLTIAGLRYCIGGLALLPWLWKEGASRAMWSDRKMWARLMAIGLSAYVLGNGGMALSLKYLPATTVSFMMSLTPILVLVGGVIWLREVPTRWQVCGVLLTILGGTLFFSRGWSPGEALGFVIALVSLLGFVFFALLGRDVARQGGVNTLTLTAIPLVIGGGMMLAIALPVEGIPIVRVASLILVLWLALVNTALAYFLYNHALKRLTALEINIVLNLTPLNTALFAWWWLGEQLSGLQFMGMGVMIMGVFVVQRFTHS